MVNDCWNCVFRNWDDECARTPSCNLRNDHNTCQCHKTEQEMEKILGVE
jgi:hypothetical protein